MSSDELDPAKRYDPVFLFIRSDERLALLESEQADIGREFVQHKVYIDKKFDEQNATIKYLTGRMDGQVSHTGQKNTEEIGKLETRIALLEKENAELQTQLFDQDTGLIKQFDEERGWRKHINQLAIAFILIGCAGALVLWAAKNFR
jgi:hypothetical protein